VKKFNFKNGLILSSIIRNVKLKKFEIRLFYLYRKEFANVRGLNIKLELLPCTVQSIDQSELKSISEKCERYYSEEKMLKMLSKGWECLGLKYKNEIVSLRWYNFKKCDSKLLPFLLKDNEVYITGAITFNDYRGKNIAPYLSLKMYERLAYLGRTIFYSIVSFSNTSAIRFHKKIGSDPYRLYLFIELFKKYRIRFPLRQYRS